MEESSDSSIIMPKMIVEYNNLTRADSSAIYCFGKTVYQSALYGPTDITSSKEDSEKATFNCIFKRRIISPRDDPDIKMIEYTLTKILESCIHSNNYPRTLINLIVQEMQSDGDLIASAINTSTLCLIDSGISLKFLIAAVNIGIKNDKSLILNPNNNELENCQANVTLSYSSRSENIVSIIHDGIFTMKDLDKCIKLGQNVAKKIFEFYKNSIKKRFSLKTE